MGSKMKEVEGNSELAEDVINSYRLALTERIIRNIAHEVRNPLTNVMLGLDQLKNELEPVDEGAEVYFSIIQRNCERINQLITNLVDSVKHSDLILENNSINQLIEEALSISESKLKEKNIVVKKSLATDLPSIKIDSAKFRTAFGNLFQNAIQAIQTTDGLLEVETHKKDSLCVIKIKDNGVGIDKEHLQKIFDPFFRMKTNGAGLGLTTAQNIINTHKGSISVQSTPGKGSEFTVALQF
jgi:two-component system, sporulation sensor kinase E